MEIIRINSYQDHRFSQEVLNQHGGFLVNGEPYEIKIVSASEAVIKGPDSGVYEALIEDFRFYTPHITVFYDQNGDIYKEFAPKTLIRVNLRDIQPSQFYVDSDKIQAIQSFILQPNDIIIQVTKQDGRYISLDGHTRLYFAVMQGWSEVLAVEEKSGQYIYGFVEEAIKREIRTPYDLMLISHAEYEEKWNKFCDDYFAQKEEKNIDT